MVPWFAADSTAFAAPRGPTSDPTGPDPTEQGVFKGVRQMVAESSYGHAVADEVASDAMVRRDPVMTRELAPMRRDPQIRRAPNSAGLYDVLDLILDKGIVIDAFVRVSLVGIELVTVDLRVVIASVDTYLRYAEGAERLQLYNRGQEKKLPDVVGAQQKGSMMKEGVHELGETLRGRHDDGNGQGGEGDEHEGVGGRLADGVRSVLTRGVGGIMKRLSGSEESEGGQHGHGRDDDEQNGRPEQRDRE